jgi:hypothetical protein
VTPLASYRRLLELAGPTYVTAAFCVTVGATVLAVVLMTTQRRRLRAATTPHELPLDVRIGQPAGSH